MNTPIQVFVWTQVFIFLGQIPRSGIARPYGNSMFDHLRSCQTFPKQLHRFTLPLAVYEGASFSTSLPTLVIACLFYYNHASGCEVLFRCGFDLHFLDDNLIILILQVKKLKLGRLINFPSLHRQWMVGLRLRFCLFDKQSLDLPILYCLHFVFCLSFFFLLNSNLSSLC